MWGGEGEWGLRCWLGVSWDKNAGQQLPHPRHLDPSLLGDPIPTAQMSSDSQDDLQLLASKQTPQGSEVSEMQVPPMSRGWALGGPADRQPEDSSP